MPRALFRVVMYIMLQIHPEPLDHHSLLNRLKTHYVDQASALYESKLRVNLGLTSSGNNFYTETYDRGTAFNLQSNGYSNYYSTNRIDGIGEELLDLADKMVKRPSINTEDAFENDLDSHQTHVVDISRDSPWTENYEDELKVFLIDIEKLVRSEDVRYSINAEIEFINKRYQSTQSLDVVQTYILSFISIDLLPRQVHKSVRRSENIGGIDKPSFNWEYIEHKVNSLVDEVKLLESSRRPKSGLYPILLSEDASYSLIHETIGHGCEGDNINNNSSYLSKSLGYKVSSTELTVIDYPHIRSMGWNEFDDEGTKAQGTILVSEGILTGFLHSKQSASESNTHSTGNARTSTYLAPPSPRQTNLMVEPRDWSNEELIEGIKNGLLLGPSITASTSIFTGEFSIESQITYEIVNGEIINSLGPCTFTGSSNETLGNISQIGDEPIMISSPCLKTDSRVYVGSLMPKISIKDARIQ